MKVRKLFETRYDAAISLAGQDDGAKETAESIVNLLTQKGLKIYYYLDPTEASLMPGKTLDETLKQVYLKSAKLVIIIASKSYAKEGYTQKEWQWIDYRRTEHNNEDFLIPIKLVSNRKELHKEVSKLGFVLGDNIPEAISNLVFRRLGVWNKLKYILYFCFSLAGLLSLIFRFIHIENVAYIAEISCVLTIVLCVLWWIIFRIIPQTRPDLLYRPTDTFKTINRWLYVNLLTEKVSFVSIAFLLLVSHILLPSLQLQIDENIQNWLSDVPVKQEVALDFFSNDIQQKKAINAWTPILVNRSQNKLYRGKALNMIYQVLDGNNNISDQSKEKDISGLLRTYGENGDFGLTGDNWHSALVDVDFSQTPTLDHSNFSALNFIGSESSLANTSIKQAKVAGGYFHTIEMSDGDFWWSDFSNSAFLGVEGNANFSGSELQNTNFFGCNLNNADFERANLTGATFTACKLQGVDFTNAVMTGVTFNECDLTGASFVDNEVQWVDVWGDLSGVTFYKSILDNVQFEEASFEPNYVELAKKSTREITYKETTVYSRVTNHYKPQEDALIANFTIPATLFLETSLKNTDFTNVKAKEMYMDTDTYNALSDKQKAQLASGGFNSERLISPIKDKGEIIERYPMIKEYLWESTKNNLDKLFEEYQKIQ